MTAASEFTALTGIDEATTAIALIVAVGAMAALVVALRRVGQRGSRGDEARRQPSMTARRAQILFDRAVHIAAPSVVAAAVVTFRTGHAGIGLLVAACAAFAGMLAGRSRHPLSLMPLSRVLLRLGAPVIGIGAALLPALFGEWQLTLDAAFTALMASWLIVGFGMWLKFNFDADRPIRLAYIGSAELARKLALEMREMGTRNYVVVGYIAEAHQPVPDASSHHVLPHLGNLDEVRDVVRLFQIDLIMVGQGQPRLAVFERTASACLDLPVRMLEANAFYEEVLGHVPIGQINSAWFQCIMHPRYQPTSPLSKRLFDLAIAIPVAVLALPLILAAALAVKLGDGGPVLYRQRRVGEQGREFNIFKFRTMRSDAFELAGTVPKEDLITPVGRVLRRLRIDELPQLYNVLLGEMTIVGPRPEQPQLVEQLARVIPYYTRRTIVRPGLTGWAQIRCGYAGTEGGSAWKICHDLYYVKRRTIVFDLLIVLQTLGVVLQGSEAELPTPAEDFILGEAAGLPTR